MDTPHSRLLLAGLALLALALPMLPVAVAGEPAASAKIEPALLDRLSRLGSADLLVRFAEQPDLSPAYEMGWAERGEFVVQALQEVSRRSQAQARAYLRSHGIAHRTLIAGNELYIWAGDLAAAEALAGRPEVASIRLPRIYSLGPVIETAPASPAPIDWGIADTRADQFWDSFRARGEGIVVANIDSGVQWDHPALVGQFKCPGSPADPACWYDPTGVCGSTPCDNNGHGTHTMGTMVAADDPALPHIAGMAPHARWIACKGCASSSCSEASLLACADWILAPGGDPANRPHVVNSSWSGADGCDAWYRAPLQSWRAAGIFPAFSAGNTASGCGTLDSPGDYPESFASAAHNAARNVAPFSSRGPSCFGHTPYTKPNLSAPGVGICSTVPTDSWSCSYSGTSMASPHTAGAVALLWSCASALVGQVDLTFQVLQDSADPPPAGNCGAPADGQGNYAYGYGYLDIFQAGQRWCGAAGTLAGHVRDSASPVDGASVVAVRAGGGSFSTTTDLTGSYALSLAVGGYNVTASAYGYLPATEAGVRVSTATATVQDFSLVPAARYLVSGTVVEAGTGRPLHAQVQVVGAPLLPAWTDPASGFYSLTIAAGTYTWHATAAAHRPVDRTVVVGHDQTQDFRLPLLPCILLVDDDQGAPDVDAYYTRALDGLGYRYDLWDTHARGDPVAADLLGYRTIVWFTGYPFADTFSGANEAAVATYLDGGGNFFLSSEDYLYERALTPFGQNYLGITSYTNDTEEISLLGNAGSPIGSGLGPYTLMPPPGWRTLYTDYVQGPSAPFRWRVSGQGNSTSKEGGTYRAVFFGWPLEGLARLDDRVAVLGAILRWFGDCGCEPVLDAALAWAPTTPTVGLPAYFTATAGGTPPFTYTWDWGDGTAPLVTTAPAAGHTFSSTGTFTVTLGVRNGCAVDQARDVLVVALPEERWPVYLPLFVKGGP